MKDEFLVAMNHVYTEDELQELLGDAWDLYGIVRMAQGKVYDKDAHIEVKAALRQAERLVWPLITFLQWSNCPGRATEGVSNDRRASAA